MAREKNRMSLLEYGLVLVLACGGALFAGAQEGPVRTLELPPGEDNPRNSEASFITLKDGRIIYLYTHFTGKSGHDHAPSFLATRTSSDGGRTWTKEDRVVVRNEGAMNIMETHLLRLRGGAIAMLYLVKNSERDCRPVIRFSSDECETWSAPVPVITDKVGYYPGNNDRVIQMKSGRLVVPTQDSSFTGGVLCYLSDDEGQTWRRNAGGPVNGFNAAGKKVITQEPGVVELKDGRVMMFMRTDQGCQYLSWSKDGGETWSRPEPSELYSPKSPAAIKRIPSTGDLLLVWNNHKDAPEHFRKSGRPGGIRVPLSTAISKDEGKTWLHVKALEGNPTGWYCYTAVLFTEDAVLLGYSAINHLTHSRITRIPVSWLYQDAPQAAPLTDALTAAVFFEGAPTGAFDRVETKLGVWRSESGPVKTAACKFERGTGIRIPGGKDKILTLTVPQAVSCKDLTFQAERVSGAKPYALALEAKVGDVWKKIGEQGEDVWPDGLVSIPCAEKELAASQFRLRCTSPDGCGAIVICLPPGFNFNGFFND